MPIVVGHFANSYLITGYRRLLKCGLLGSGLLNYACALLHRQMRFSKAEDHAALFREPT